MLSIVVCQVYVPGTDLRIFSQYFTREECFEAFQLGHSHFSWTPGLSARYHHSLRLHHASLNLERTSISRTFLCLLIAKNGFLGHMRPSNWSSSMMCQYFLKGLFHPAFLARVVT